MPAADLAHACPRRRDQFTLDLMEKVPQGAGSGTIWDTDGHVVTNAHVIAGASDLQVSSLLALLALPWKSPVNCAGTSEWHLCHAAGLRSCILSGKQQLG